jgi:hypothetical protein
MAKAEYSEPVDHYVSGAFLVALTKLDIRSLNPYAMIAIRTYWVNRCLWD